jgi:hypothetical protein
MDLSLYFDVFSAFVARRQSPSSSQQAPSVRQESSLAEGIRPSSQCVSSAAFFQARCCFFLFVAIDG